MLENLNSNFTDSFKDLFEMMTTPNPNNRITISKIREHPWFT